MQRVHPSVLIDGRAVEYTLRPGVPGLAPLVFLHEGLGSIDLWRGVPDDVRAAMGDDRTVLVYSRYGYGRSSPAVVPRPVDYMHREADEVLPALLDALDLHHPILIGHSDGASIALLYAGAGHAVTALVCLAPHVFVEPESVAGAAEARRVFDTTDMAERLARYHDDPRSTFLGWNDIWRSPAFRTWNIEERLSTITSPVLVIQGAADQYGTTAQVDAVVTGVSGPVASRLLADTGHAPHLEARDEVVAAIATFLLSVG